MVTNPELIRNAVRIFGSDGDTLWQSPEENEVAATLHAEFQIAAGGSFTIATASSVETPLPTAVPAEYFYEDDSVRLTASVADASLLPEGAQWNATVTGGSWADFAQGLQAEGYTEADAKQILNVGTAFTADGETLNTADIPVSYTLLLKNADFSNAEARVLAAGSITPVDSLTQTDEGAQLNFTETGIDHFSVAMLEKTATQALVYENDAVRITVTPSDPALLPNGAQLEATVSDGEWDTFADLLQQQGFDQTRVQRMLNVSAAITADGEAVDTSAMQLRYDVLIKGAAYEGSQAWVLADGAAAQADDFTQSPDGDLATFTQNGELRFGLAVTLPGRTVYTYEDDQLYVVATLSRPDAVPDGAQLVVKPVEMTDQLTAYADNLTQPDPSVSPEPTVTPVPGTVVTQAKEYTYQAYDIHFEVNGEEYEPQDGTVNVALTYKQVTAAEQNPTDVKVLHVEDTNGSVAPVEIPSDYTTDGSQALQTVTFETGSFSIMIIAVETNTTVPVITVISDASQTYTNTDYYLSRVLGIAGNFHLVGFNSVDIGVHTNGNILTANLYATTAFGTHNLTDELSYIQNYKTVSTNSGSSTKHVLALGTANTIGYADNGNSFTVNGTKIDTPKNIYQDANTATLPFIDIGAVRTSASDLSGSLSGKSNRTFADAKTIDSNSRPTIALSTAGATDFISATASEISDLSGADVNLTGFTSGSGTMVFNVNCAGASSVTMPVRIHTYINGVETTLSETTSWGSNRVLWNFYNCSSSMVVNVQSCKAAILAPNAKVVISPNGGTFNGTVIAENIYSHMAESHRDDFMGSLNLTVNVTANKTWKDENGNTLNPVPANFAATMQLYRTDKNGATEAFGDPVTLPENGSWSHTWPKLSTSYTYSVKETAVNGTAVTTVNGSDTTGAYTVSYSDANVKSGDIEVVNRKIPTVQVAVTKSWDFSGASETPTLPAVTYSLYDHANPAQGDTPVQTISVPRGSAQSAYNVSFTELPKYNAQGALISYTVRETVQQGYTVTQNGNAFTNKLVVTSVSGQKTWEKPDGTAYTGYRPSIRVTLLRNNSAYAHRDFPAALNGAAADYAYTFTSLPKYDPDGIPYVYSIQETAVDGFTTAFSGTNLINTQKSTSIIVTKRWNDNGYAYPAALTRPAVTISLYNGVDSQPVSSHTFPTNESNYTYTFSGLPEGVYGADGKYAAYTYSVQESGSTGYTLATTTGDGSQANPFVLTNKLDTVALTVQKNWVLSNISLVNVPAITVTLLQNGAEFAGRTIPAGNVSRADYTWTWSGLPKTDPLTGDAYHYTVAESMAGNAAAGFTTGITYDNSTPGLLRATVTNTQKTVRLAGAKIWLDQAGNSYTGHWPAFTVTLYQNDSVYSADPTRVFAADSANLGYTFESLPQYDPDGTPYTYRVAESAVDGFTASYTAVTASGNTLTADIENRLKATVLTVDKQWLNGDTDVTGSVNRTVTVQLTRKTASMSAAEDVPGETALLASTTSPKYRAVWNGLPAGTVTESGAFEAYTYSVRELQTTGYQSVVGTTVVNSDGSQYVLVSNTRALTQLTVAKQWLAADGIAAIPAPEGATVTVQLMSSVNGSAPTDVPDTTVELNGTAKTASAAYESAPWTATFTGLPTHTEDGQPITYSARESGSTNAAGFWASSQAGENNEYFLRNNQTIVRVTKHTDGNGAALAGAAFKITGVSDPAETYVLAGSAITSDWTQLGLKTDTVYELVETVTPAGYLTAAPVRFRIDGSNGSVYTDRDLYVTPCEDHTIDVVDESITLKVAKLNVNVETATADELNGLYADHFVTGAELTLYALEDQNTPLQVIASTEDHTAYELDASKLQQGKTYIIKETVTPAGYQTASPVTFTAGSDPSGTIYVLFDEPIPYQEIVVQKNWAEDSAPKDVTFDLYRNGDDTPIESVTLPAGETSIAFPGNAAISVNHRYPTRTQSGDPIAYTVRERAVAGYVVSAPMSQSVEGSTLINQITNAPTVVTFSKKGITGGEELPGARLTLTDHADSTKSWTWVSGETPHIITGELEAGHTYTLTETTAPNGYAVSESVTFTVNADGTLQPGTVPANAGVDAATGTVTMRDKPLSVTISKKTLTGTEELPGASLTLRDTTDQQTVASWLGTTTAKTFGSTIYIADASTNPVTYGYQYATEEQQYPLMAGHHYELTETAAPNGYLVASNITFTIDPSGAITEASAAGSVANTTVTLRDAPNTFQIIKEDGEGNRLPGAVFQLYLYDGQAADHLGARVFADRTLITDSNGIYAATGLINGQRYVLRETEAPAGYNLAADTVFTYADNQQTIPLVSVTVKDTLASFRVRKTDTNGTPVAGAQLSVYNSDRTKRLWSGTSTATGEGWITVSADPGETDASRFLVKGGNYNLREETAPKGYALNAEYIPFTFGENGSTEVTCENAPLALTVSKKDLADGAEIAGAHLVLTDHDESNSLVDEWDSAANTSHEVEAAKLTAGHTYTLTETIVPDGYIRSQTVQFKIQPDGTVSLVGGAGSVNGTNVVMTDDRTLLSIEKTGIANASLTEGVQFTLYASDAEGTKGLQVGSEGLAFNRLIPGGYYWLYETTVPQGYVPMAPLHFQFTYDALSGATAVAPDQARTDVTVTAAANGKATLTVNDAPTSVAVRKLDEQGNPLAGASLAIYTDHDGTPGTEVSGTGFITATDDPLTAEDESIHILTGVLTQGQRYWLVETAAPEDYALAAPVSFTAGSDAQTVTVTMTDKALSLTIDKRDSDARDESGTLTGERVPNVTLTLTGPYALNGVTEDNHTWSWNTSDAESNPLTLTMADGLVPGGTYVLHEKTPNPSYQVAEDQTVVLPVNGGAVHVVMVDAAKAKLSVKVTKVFTAADGSALAQDDPLPASVTVNLYREGIENPVASHTLTAVENWTYTFTNLDAGYVYTVQEAAVPGFTLRQITADQDPTDNFAYTLTNAANEGRFSKRMLGESGAYEELSGAHLQLLTADGSTVIAEWVSGEQPHVVRGLLEPDTEYILKETAAPEGYLVTSAFAFRLDAQLNPTLTQTTVNGGVDGGVVYMVDNATTVTVSKRAVEGTSELPGAHFAITHLDAASALEVTDAEWTGTATPKTINGLAVGVAYTLTEQSAPAGYRLAASVQFLILPDGGVVTRATGDTEYTPAANRTLTVLDDPTVVTFSKKGITGGEELPGAHLTLTDHADSTKSWTWVSGETPHIITGELEAGHTYTLTETTAPNGYAVSESVTFTVNADGTLQPGTVPANAGVDAATGTVTMRDKPLSVTISKKTLTGTEELPGASLTLRDTTDQQTIASWLGTTTAKTFGSTIYIADASTNPVTYGYQYATEEQQYPLIAGHRYELTETAAPNGYLVASNITFTIDPSGAITEVSAAGSVANTTVTLRDAPTALNLLKVDDTGAPVAGAELTLYSVSGPEATTPGETVATVTTGAEGTANVTGILNPDRWYIAAETVTPAGYVTATPSAPFRVRADGTPAQITLTDPRTSFAVGKRDADTGETVGGAVLAVYDSKTENGTLTPDTETELARVTTSAGEDAVLYGLELNHTYYLYELTAPAGYLRDEALYTPFTVAADGTTAVYAYDEKTATHFNKTDAKGNRIGGAELILVQGDGVTYTQAEIADRWISSETEDHTVRGLKIGQPYTLLEVSAPTGYLLNATGVSFMLNGDGQVISASGAVTDSSTTNLVSMIDYPAEVSFSKRATGAGTAELPGATLTITHVENGTTLTDDRWVSGDEHNRDASGNPIPHLVTGTLKADGSTEYTFTEVGAPDGFTVAGSIVFRIQPDGTVQIRQPNGNWDLADGKTVVMTDAPTRVKIAKVDAVTGVFLPGAEFAIVADQNGAPAQTPVSGYERIVSGEEAITVDGLPVGNYWLVETAAPVGRDANGEPVYYQTATPVAFSVTDELLPEAQLVSVTVSDQPTNVTIQKLDSLNTDADGHDTGNRVAGATLTLTRKGETQVLATYTYNGTADWVLDNGLLQPGVTYVLTETPDHTPDGYLAAFETEFTLAADGNGVWVVVDQPIPKTQVTVNKVWNDQAAQHPDVTLDLYRSDDPTTPYRTQTIVSPETSVTFADLPTQAKDHSAYTYSVQERPVPGYLPGVLSDPTITPDGTTEYTVTNTPTVVTIDKLAADTALPQAGAHFRLVLGNGTAYAGSEIVAEWVSGEDGVNADGTYKPHTLTGVVETGRQYTLLETMAPSGYLTADPVTFTLSENGTIVGSASNRITVTDLPVTVRFAKVDNLTGLLVAGAGFSVYDDAQWQQSATAAVPVYTFTSNGSYVEVQGVFTAGRLYRLVETSAPAGYQVNAASLQFRAPAENATLTLRVTNPRVYQFQKLSSADGRAVTGAQLTVLDESGNTVIAPWYSGTTPYEFVNSDASGAPILKAGILYRLVELTAPAGYSLNTASVTFRLDQTGLINGGTSVTMYNTPTASPTPSTMDLTLRKTWRDHDNAGNTRPTGGLVVNVYRRPVSAGNYSLLVTVTIPYRNDNNWYLTLRNLPRYDNNGTEYQYMAREEVPAGYTVTYANNGFTMVNTYPDNNESPTPIPTLTPTPPAATVTPYVPTNVAYVDGQWVYIDDNGVPLGVLPQTGDETSWTLLAIAIVAPLLLAGFAAWWIFRKKRRYAKR